MTEHFASFGAAAGAAMAANARQAAELAVSRCDVDWHSHPDGVFGESCRPDPVAGGNTPEDER